MSSAVSECCVIETDFIAKHKIVQIKFTGKIVTTYVQRMVRAPKLMGNEGVGPRPAHQPVPLELTALIEEGEHFKGQGALDQAMSWWLRHAAGEVQRQLVTNKTHREGRWGNVPRLIWEPAVAPSYNSPAAGKEAHVWRRLEAKMLLLCSMVGSGPVLQWRHDAMKMWQALLKYCPPGGKPDGWRQWRITLRSLPRMDIQEVEEFIQWVRRAAETLETAAAQERYQKFWQWAAEQAKVQGAAAIYRWIKGPQPWTAFEVEIDQAGGLGTPQGDANARAAVWHRIWGVDSETQTCTWPSEQLMSDGMEFNCTVQDVREAAATFKVRTAIGSDDLHPRHLAVLGDETLEVLISLWKAMVCTARVPECISLTLVALLPKQGGGDRPVGIMPTICRVLHRLLRRSYGKQWLQKNERGYRYGKTNASALHCAWRQAALAEYAHHRGETTAAVLFDLQKAYDTVDHRYLMEQACRYGFSLKLLKYLLAVYQAPRMITIRQVATAPVRVIGKSLMPGDSFADLLMYLTLIKVTDEMAANFPSINLAMLADDTQFLVCGKAGQVGRTAAVASRTYVRKLEECCLLTVSTKKLSLICSQASTSKEIENSFGRLKGAAKTSDKMLGVDYSAARRVRRPIQAKRINESRPTAGRIRRLRKAKLKTSRFVKTALLPKMLYGVPIVGMSKAAVQKARRLVHGALIKKHQARSATVDLALDMPELDPTYAGNVGVVQWWAAALWEQWLPRHMLLYLMSKVSQELKGTARPFSRVRGPASATVATLMRLGWAIRDPITIVDKKGELMSFDQAPLTTKAVISESVETMIWEQYAAKRPCSRLGGRPYLEPLRKLLCRPKGDEWSGQHIGMLRSVMADGIWSAERMHRAGYIIDPMCEACGVTASVHHTVYECCLTAPFRDSYDLAPTFLTAARNRKDDSFFTRPFLPCILEQLTPPSEVPDIRWDMLGGATFKGSTFGDGSGIYKPKGCKLEVGTDPMLLRCGWAVASFEVIDGCITKTTMAWGPLPGRMQTIPAAELFGLWIALMNCELSDEPFVYYTDCKWVADGWLNGVAIMGNAWTPHSDLWRKVFHKAEDIGQQAIQVVWTKGHRGEDGQTQNNSSIRDKFEIRCNAIVDAQAKRGAGLHNFDLRVLQRIARARNAVIQVAKFVASCLLWSSKHLPRTHGEIDRQPSTRYCKRGDGTTPQCIVLGHDPMYDCDTNRWRCTRCLSSGTSLHSLSNGQCIQIHEGFIGHNVWQLGNHVFCCKCGAFSCVRSKGLRNSCPGGAIAHQKHRLQRMWEGKDPVTGKFVARPTPYVPVHALPDLGG